MDGKACEISGMLLVDVDRIYCIWQEIKAQCRAGTDPSSADYGKSAATISHEWREYRHFVGWALTSGYADHLEIARADPLGPFGPENCRWIEPAVELSDEPLADTELSSSRLTPEAVAVAVAAKVQAKWWDDDNLYLRVTKNGKAEWFFCYQAGVVKKLRLGQFPAVSLEEARALRLRAERRLDGEGTISHLPRS